MSRHRAEPSRRRSRARARALPGVALLLVVASAGACGSRTGLFVDEESASTTDGGPDARADGDLDARADGRADVEEIPDALPPIDVRPPQDVDRRDCPDADATLVYVATINNEIFSFYPPDGTFKKIGNIACPAAAGTTPFSMAVDRKGIAYVLFNDGNLFRVSTLTAACVATPFQPGQSSYVTFGMGFATIAGGPAEKLFVAGDEQNNTAGGLASIDVASWQLTPIGAFVPDVNRAELTGTGDGRLFAFYTKGTGQGTGSFIGEIDKSTAAVTAEEAFPTLDQGTAWAFASWGGDFYMFTAPSTGSRVTRFRPADKSLAQIATLPTRIIGAGVSTCAPSQ